MTQHDIEILQLAQRIQMLSRETVQKTQHDSDDMLFRLKKISDLASALVPRIEAKCVNS
jgi:hypothetical protein